MSRSSSLPILVFSASMFAQVAVTRSRWASSTSLFVKTSVPVGENVNSATICFYGRGRVYHEHTRAWRDSKVFCERRRCKWTHSITQVESSSVDCSFSNRCEQVAKAWRCWELGSEWLQLKRITRFQDLHSTKTFIFMCWMEYHIYERCFTVPHDFTLCSFEWCISCCMT